MLNEHQHRVLSVTFGTVELYLRSIEKMLSAEDFNGILCGWENNVSSSQKDLLAAKISEAMERIRMLSEQFSLEKTREYARQNILAKLSYCWEILQGVKAKRLKGYGEVDSSLEHTLDPQIDMLVALLREMQSLLQGAIKHDR
jgi:hypothetical protein